MPKVKRVTARRQKPGPKPRPAATLRTVMVRIMVRPSELDELRARAGFQSLSSYLREKGLAQ